jgi:hypothetical protein
MPTTAKTIDHTTFENLVEAGAVRGADVIGHPGGWSIVVRFGTTERTLAQRRGAVRSFRKMETLIRYLKDVGVSQFNVNTANYDPTLLKTTRVRPDSAARMKAAFDASAHDKWIQTKVAQSLADNRPNVSHSEAMDTVQALIDAQRTKHANKAKA